MRVLAVAAAGAVFEPLEFSLQRPDDEPRVDRQLIADDVDRLEHVADRVGDGSRALIVDHEREQLVGRVVEQRLCIVADEPGVGAGDPRQRFEQDGQRCRTRAGRGLVELVAPNVDRADQAHGRLGALGISSEPEQMLGSAGGQCVDRDRWRRTGRLRAELDDVGGIGSDHPHVLRLRAGQIRDRPGQIAGTGTGEPARHRHVRVALRHGERAQHGGAWSDPRGGQHGCGTGYETFLSHPLAGPGRDAPSQLVEVGRTRPRRVDRVLERRARERTYDEFAEVGENVRTTRRIAAPPRRDRLQHEIGVEEVRRQRAHQPPEPGVLEDAGAEGVDHAHRAGATGVGQPGNPERRIGAQFQRVAESGVDAAHDHVDRHPSADGAQTDATVAQLEVRSLHQWIAELRCHRSVFEGGFRQRTRRQDHDRRVVDAVGHRAEQGRPHRLDERSQALDARRAEEVGEHPRHHAAVLDRVRRA